MPRLIRHLDRLIRRRKRPARPDEDPIPAGEDRWGAAFRPPDWIRRTDSLWPEIRKRMEEKSPAASAPAGPKPRNRHLFRWAVASAGMIGLAVLIGLLGERRRPNSPEADSFPESSRITVISAEIRGQEAKSSIFQTKSASFIWIYRTSDNGGPR
jgi:hypothetical protein